MKAIGNLHQQAALQYKIGILRKGKLVAETPFRAHLITDAGLDKVATTNWLACLNNPILGENATPTAVRRDSGAVTFTQTGNTLTASNAFFVAADVGRLFKWGTGSAGAEVYITGYTSATVVTVGTSAEVAAPEVGTVWYVNTAALLTPITGLTWTKNNSGAENFSSGTTSGDTCTVTHQTVFYSSALASPKTVTEIAFNNSGTNASVFDRDNVTPTVGLLAGDQAKVTVQLIVKYAPITPVSVANVATGYDSAGEMQIESVRNDGAGIAAFDAAGAILFGGGNQLEPGSTAAVAISALKAAVTFAPFSITTGATIGANDTKVSSVASYGTGNRYRDLSATFSITEANGTIYGVCIGASFQGGRYVTVKFTTPFTKLSTQTLSFTFRKSWSRVLTN